MMECEIFWSISIGQENKGVDVIARLRSSATIPASNEPGSRACEDIYKKDIEDVTKLLDQAVKDKTVTSDQKDSILKKMNENLAKLN